MTGLLQGVLLGMGISFEIRERKKRRQGEGNSPNEHAVSDGDETDERTGLIGSEQ